MVVSVINDDEAMEIAKLYQELSAYLDGKQISTYYDMKFMDCAYHVHMLSNETCVMSRYLSNSNFENGRYKITLSFKYKEDENLVEKYLQEIN